jgi:purine nucleosidase
MSKQLVLMDHDGGVDDYLATMLLMTMKHIQTLSIVVTPADCYIQPAVSATHKILDLVGRSDIPVAESTVRGINPFPTIYRRDSFVVDHLPIVNERDEIQTALVKETGQEVIVRSLLTYELQEWETVIVTTGKSQGRTPVGAGSRKMQAMDKVNREKYYPYIMQQWTR